MRSLKIIILIILSTSTLFAQKIDKKIEQIIDLQKKQTDYFTNKQTDLMGDIIDYILKEKYEDKYSHYYVPFSFDTTEYNKKIYYYKTANVTIDQKLFYWCVKNDQNKWLINSMIIDSLYNTNAEYKMTLLDANNQKTIVFKSDEANFLLNDNENKKIQRIDYEFEELKNYNFIYVQTNVENGKIKWTSEKQQNIFKDAILDSLMLKLRKPDLDSEKQSEILNAIEVQSKNIKNNSNNDKTIYLTELLINDLNHDTIPDYYWLALSNGEIIYYNIYNWKKNNWINIKNSIDVNIFKNDAKLSELIELTK